MDLWFSLANSTYFPAEPSEWMLEWDREVLMKQLRESLSGAENLAADSEIRDSNARARNIRASVSDAVRIWHAKGRTCWRSISM